MTNISFIKRIKYIVAVAALSGIFLTACGEEDTSYVENGMNAISALDYDTALDAFSQAEEAEEDERLILRGRGMALMAKLEYEEGLGQRQMPTKQVTNSNLKKLQLLSVS